VISGLSPGAEKAGEDLYKTYVPNGTKDIIIIIKAKTSQTIMPVKSHYAISNRATYLENYAAYK
jgi:hypothetical protein